jgi:glucosamine 6-phosphate synthetase-like amidotransferase/phosphosugar isomerase protein
MEGLSILESRGYDSAGVTTINEQNELVTSKFASSQSSTSDAIARLKGAGAVCFSIRCLFANY